MDYYSPYVKSSTSEGKSGSETGGNTGRPQAQIPAKRTGQENNRKKVILLRPILSQNSPSVPDVPSYEALKRSRLEQQSIRPPATASESLERVESHSDRQWSGQHHKPTDTFKLKPELEELLNGELEERLREEFQDKLADEVQNLEEKFDEKVAAEMRNLQEHFHEMLEAEVKKVVDRMDAFNKVQNSHDRQIAAMKSWLSVESGSLE